MKIALALVICLIVAVAALQAYVRFAPTDPARWHVDPGLAGAEDTFKVMPGGVRVARIYNAAPNDILSRVDQIARASPRTQAIAGSTEDGMTTYQTLSAFWGFPDFTTVTADPLPDGRARLRIHARLRFGGGDLGVNAARVENWLNQLP